MRVKYCRLFTQLYKGALKKNLHQQPQKRKGGGSANAPHCARSASDRAPFLQMLVLLRMRLELLIWRQRLKQVCSRHLRWQLLFWHQKHARSRHFDSWIFSFDFEFELTLARCSSFMLAHGYFNRIREWVRFIGLYSLSSRLHPWNLSLCLFTAHLCQCWRIGSFRGQRWWYFQGLGTLCRHLQTRDFSGRGRGGDWRTRTNLTLPSRGFPKWWKSRACTGHLIEHRERRHRTERKSVKFYFQNKPDDRRR